MPERRATIDHYKLARALLRLAQAEYDASHGRDEHDTNGAAGDGYPRPADTKE